MKNKVAMILITMAVIIALPVDTMGQKKGRGGPPPWAPAHGYRAKTRHIYFPEQNFYFDLQRNLYIYPDVHGWHLSAKIPSVFSAIDLRNAAKIELELNTNEPQRYNTDHQAMYRGSNKAEKDKMSKGKVPPGQAKKENRGKGKNKHF